MLFVDDATATTGAVMFPADSGVTSEPSSSTRRTGVSGDDVPTNNEPSCCQSKVSAVFPMLGAI